MTLSPIFELKKANLSLFGWLSIILTILTIPYLALSFIAGLNDPYNTGPSLTSSLVTLIYTFVFVSVFYYFKVLLNKKYKFFKADKVISWFIYLNIILTVVIEVLGYATDAEAIKNTATFASLIPIGIASIAFGIKLLSLENTLYGLKKHISISLISSGILYASVILFIIALIPSLILTALIGVVFLREANQN